MTKLTPGRVRLSEISNQDVWSAIHNLDPEKVHEENNIPVIVAMLTVILIWGSMLFLLHAS